MEELSSLATALLCGVPNYLYHRAEKTLAKRILIVEDDTALRRFFRISLAMAGFEVEEASDGIDALHLIENRAPDLVVLDLVLRALDGISVRQELASRAVTRDIPIVIVTGSAIDTSMLDVACVLRKPVSPDELVRAIRQCLASGASTASA